MTDTSLPEAPKTLRHHLGTLLVLAMKLAKSFKLVKVALFGASAASYAWLMSWEFAAVILMAIAIHEYGHVKAMRLMGMPTKGMYFLPFLGAVAVGSQSRSRFEEAFIALMGPAFGVLSLLPMAALGLVDGDPRWFAYLGMIAFVNLFNLLPIAILDGGRTLSAIAHSLGHRLGIAAFVASMGLGAVVTWQLGSIVLAVIMALAIPEFLGERRRQRQSAIPPMSRRELAATTTAYLGLFVLFLLVISAVAGIEGADLAHRVVSD